MCVAPPHPTPNAAQGPPHRSPWGSPPKTPDARPALGRVWSEWISGERLEQLVSLIVSLDFVVQEVPHKYIYLYTLEIPRAIFRVTWSPNTTSASTQYYPGSPCPGHPVLQVQACIPSTSNGCPVWRPVSKGRDGYGSLLDTQTGWPCTWYLCYLCYHCLCPPNLSPRRHALRSRRDATFSGPASQSK